MKTSSDYSNQAKQRAGIISIHYGVNFGSSLQAYALSRYISDNYNIKAEIINYIPPRYRNRRLYRFTEKGPKDFAYWIIRSLRYMRIDMKYKAFLEKIANVSKPVYTIEEASKRYKGYEFLIAGSDQIWNSDYNEGIDPMYYLCFASDDSRKIAYAASAGKTDFTDEEWSQQRDYLRSFFKISYREKQLLNLMEQHGVPDGSFVLDPTYLLDDFKWSLIEKKPQNKPDNFLLIYFLDTDERKMIDQAKNIAKQLSLHTVLICNGRKNRYSDIDYVATNLTPDYYIWFFRHAQYIVTNSFHGVSFSINLKKQFAAFKRDKYNSRLDSILEAFGLQDRYITVDAIENAFKPIDYQVIDELKNKFLLNSKSFLDEALGN